MLIIFDKKPENPIQFDQSFNNTGIWSQTNLGSDDYDECIEFDILRSEHEHKYFLVKDGHWDGYAIRRCKK